MGGEEWKLRKMGGERNGGWEEWGVRGMGGERNGG